MLILLPPSEGKAARGTSKLRRLSFPELASPREKVLDALVTLCRTDEARAVLGLSDGQAGDLVRNGELHTALALPVAELYTGVLYDNLGLSTLSPEARRRADRRIVVFSGLWGLLRLTDRVPPYRLSMGVRLPPMGGLAAFWRPSITAALEPVKGLVVDMRSATYAAAWQPGERSVTVRVLREEDGRRTVVSHMAKATRGAVARALAESADRPRNPHELAEVLTGLGHRAELGAPPRPGRPWTLDVIVTS
ncbi:peroxide stress protein YaaA [Planotetraspora sp. A-T 1434]|uniref:YaaA family protein n=1 Tax=Planotetraspora sp. A-T 1434 TaxID=2979219 RepID=UPI0021BF2B30|nr:peroxide stress protein YaaA [Planotetraspora sp. A-T 1434]MCT9931121.1 peroxide stress protein YaaA [Planotetraspora sp. A-T 1434]